jgi:sec-independent protein translocase protein TatC
MSEAKHKAGATAEEESLEHTRMTLGEHLDELRRRLLRGILSLLIVFCVSWVFHEEIAGWLFHPYNFARARLEPDLVDAFKKRLAADPALEWADYFERPDPQGPQDLRDNRRVPETPRGDGAGTGFLFYMRFCFYFSLFVAGPYMLWQAWQFIAAGLYKRERRVVYGYLPMSLALFVGGVLFGFFVLAPYGLYFLARQSIEQIQYWESLDTYSTFLLSMTLATGLIFQLPVVMLAISRVGLVHPSLYSKYRAHMIVAVVIVAAVITPPDVISQVLMAVPMLVLYEVGALLSRIAVRKQEARREVAAA